MDDSVIVVGSFSPGKVNNFGIPPHVGRRTPSSTAPTVSSSFKRGNKLGPKTDHSFYDDSVIILDEDDISDVNNRLEATVVIVDSEEEDMVADSTLLRGKVKTPPAVVPRLKSTQPSPTNSVYHKKGWRPTLDFNRPKPSTVTKPPPSPATLLAQNGTQFSRPTFDSNALTTKKGGNMCKPAETLATGPLNVNGVTFIPASERALNDVTNDLQSAETGPPRDFGVPLYNTAFTEVMGVEGALTPKKAGRLARKKNQVDVQMDVECASSNQEKPSKSRTVYYRRYGKQKTGGKLTMTIRSPAKPTPFKTKRSRMEQRRKSSSRDGTKDSYRHFMGISKNSRNWPKKKKDSRPNKLKATKAQSSESAVNKVVLGIQNLNSEGNVGTEVVAFTSGKSPRSSLTGNVNFDQCLKDKGLSPSANSDEPVIIHTITGNSTANNSYILPSPSILPTPSNILPTPSSPSICNSLAPSNRRVLMVNPTLMTAMQIAAMQITVSNAAATRPNVVGVHQKWHPPHISPARQPPPSPYSLLQTNPQYKCDSAANTDSSWLQQIPCGVPRPVHVQKKLRPIAIDGSNVAFAHGKNKSFSCRGIQLCVEFFKKRGHETVKAFVPQFRRCRNPLIKDQHILEDMNVGDDQSIVFTPSRKVQDRLISSYDDRLIVEYAVKSGAVMVSNDNYRDIMQEKPEFKEAIEKRLLMYTFVDDLFMVPQDPLGRNGPSLDTFLSIEAAVEAKT